MYWHFSLPSEKSKSQPAQMNQPTLKKSKANQKTNQPKKKKATATTTKKNQSERNQNQTPNQTNNHGLEETCPHFVNAFGSGLIVVLGGEEV